MKRQKQRSFLDRYLPSLPRSSSLNNAITEGAKRLVIGGLQAFDGGTLTIRDVDGSMLSLGDNGPEHGLAVEIRFHSSWAWVRILLDSDVGFSEAFMLGEISCSNLTDFFSLMLLNADAYESDFNVLSTVAKYGSAVAARLYHLTNTPERALGNARNHYSLSNEMFAAFLDESMTYSAPIWLPSSDPQSTSDTLESAQLRKLRYTIEAARIKSADHVLEIGTGWGSFAIEAVRQTGCQVTTITASDKQADLAREKIREAGYDAQIKVLVCDYREVPLPDEHFRFDKIVSIEMIEHVGYEYLDTYFACVDRYLKTNGGIGVFQCITFPETRFTIDQRRSFIPYYIFPGGFLPTVSGLVANINAGSKGRLIVEDIKSVSGHYPRALREWRKNFQKHWEDMIVPSLRATQPDLVEEDLAVFRRKWEYYFCYCEAGFATKKLGDVSITVAREGAAELIDDIPR